MSPTKAKSAKAFESVITEENRAIIERTLDAVDASSCFSGHKAVRGLSALFGKEATTFLVNLLEVNNIMKFTASFKEISPETRRYIYLLHSIYSYRLHGILTGRRETHPDAWVAMECISTTYDSDRKKLRLRFSVEKNNKDCVIIEDTIGSMFVLATNILDSVADESEKYPEFRTHLDIEQGEIKKLKDILDKLTKVISSFHKEKPSTGKNLPR